MAAGDGIGPPTFGFRTRRAATAPPRSVYMVEHPPDATGRSWQRPIFPQPYDRSIVGAGAFHFRVRYGNGWDHSALATRAIGSRQKEASRRTEQAVLPAFSISFDRGTHMRAIVAPLLNLSVVVNVPTDLRVCRRPPTHSRIGEQRATLKTKKPDKRRATQHDASRIVLFNNSRLLRMARAFVNSIPQTTATARSLVPLASVEVPRAADGEEAFDLLGNLAHGLALLLARPGEALQNPRILRPPTLAQPAGPAERRLCRPGRAEP